MKTKPQNNIKVFLYIYKKILRMVLGKIRGIYLNKIIYEIKNRKFSF